MAVSRNPVRILVVAGFDKGWTWHASAFPAPLYSWTFLKADLLHRGRRALIGHAARAAREARRHNLVITHGPWLTLFTAFFMVLFRVRTCHLAFTFNHGNGRFFSGPFLVLARAVLPSVAAFVTHSRYEMDLFSEKYRIPRAKMYFSHWSRRAPEESLPAPDYLSDIRSFVCCIGRNNRDFDTFLSAVHSCGIPAVLICGKEQAMRLAPPATTVVRTDATPAECDAVMARSMATVVPLIDESTGAGHMTIVNSLHLGTPVIATDSPVVADYVLPGQTGSLVPRGSASALAAEIDRYRADAQMRQSLQDGARGFAREFLSEESAIRFLSGLLTQFAPALEESGPGIPPTPNRNERPAGDPDFHADAGGAGEKNRQPQ